MNEQGLKFFEVRQQQDHEMVVAVGQITLSEGCGRKEYVLASIDALNRYIGRFPVTQTELEQTLGFVVRHSIWDVDHRSGSSTVFQSQGSIHREVIETLAHLSDNGLLDEMQVTDAGRQLLQSVTLVAEAG